VCCRPREVLLQTSASCSLVPSSCLPRLQTSVFHPHCYMIDTFPRTERLAPFIVPHSSPHGRRLADHPRPSADITSTRRSRPFASRALVWTTFVLGRIFTLLYIGASGLLFHMFSYLLLIQTFALHSTPSYFTLDFHHRTSPHWHRPSPLSSAQHRAPYDYSVKFSGFSDIAFHCLHRAAFC